MEAGQAETIDVHYRTTKSMHGEQTCIEETALEQESDKNPVKERVNVEDTVSRESSTV